MFQRRDLLKLTGAGYLTALAAPLSVLAQDNIVVAPEVAGKSGALQSPTTKFHQNLARDLAKTLAGRPFKETKLALPDVFSKLSIDQYEAIHRRDAALIWQDETFSIEPLHRGAIYEAAVEINLIDGDAIFHLAYSAADFDFGALKIPANLGNLGFSGFRILQRAPDGTKSEIAKFQGASFFRARAAGQKFGSASRALAIRTADPRGEEFPRFQTFWIEKPKKPDQAILLHAIVDSPSMTGAFRFTVRPGFATLIDIESTLFARTSVDHIGIAAMAASYLYGPLAARPVDKLRPRIHEIDGLQMHTGAGEWLWRPVNNRAALQISVFTDSNPKGFGFIQRDRDFSHFQDNLQQDEKRPSLWIEPIGDWGAGSIDLVEIPSQAESNDNIVAYWRPQIKLEPGDQLSLAYRQIWCWTPPKLPDLAVTYSSRSGVGSKAAWRKFAVDFKSAAFASWPKDKPIQTVLSLNHGRITNQDTFLMAEIQIFRCVFEINPDGEPLCEIRLLLQVDDKPISETWLYRWTM